MSVCKYASIPSLVKRKVWSNIRESHQPSVDWIWGLRKLRMNIVSAFSGSGGTFGRSSKPYRRPELHKALSLHMCGSWAGSPELGRRFSMLAIVRGLSLTSFVKGWFGSARARDCRERFVWRFGSSSCGEVERAWLELDECLLLLGMVHSASPGSS